MAYVVRLVLLLLFVFAGQVHANIPVQANYTYTTATWNCSSNCFASLGAGEYIGLQAACDRGAARMLVELPYFASVTVTSCVPPATNPTVGNVAVNGFGLTVQYTCKPGSGCTTGTNSVAIWEKNTGSACPANSTSSGGACTCNSGYVEDSSHTSCVVPDPCAALAGTSAGLTHWWDGATGGLGPDGFAKQPHRSSSHSYCDSWNSSVGNGKCIAVAQFEGATVLKLNGVDTWLSEGNAVYTGASGTTCNGDGGTSSSPGPGTAPTAGSGGTADPKPPDVPAPGAAAPAPCPTGQAPGTVNGASMCAPTGSDTTTAAPVKSSTTITNSDGSSTTSTQTGETTCKGSTCNTQTTCQQSTTAVDGTTSSSSCGGKSVSQSLGSACQSGVASAAQCSGDGDSSFTGDCASGFKPTGGDAVINAMALEQYTRNCQFFSTTGVNSMAFEQYSKLSGNQTTALPGNVTQDIGSLDQTDLLGGGGGPPPIHFDMFGQSVSVPMDNVTTAANWLGYIMLAITAIACVIIVFGD